MRFPPALVFTPAASRVYRVVAVAVALYLIAICVHLARATAGFDFKNLALAGFCFGVLVWLLRDAWRQPRVQLRYAQGQWFCVEGEQEWPGTLRVHLDLQSYLLVRFVPAQHNNSLDRRTSVWFHLEARHARLSPAPGAWLALRRAVYALDVADHESVAA
jgi:hypothetical protein